MIKHNKIIKALQNIFYKMNSNIKKIMCKPVTHPLKSATSVCWPLFTSNIFTDLSDEQVANRMP